MTTLRSWWRRWSHELPLAFSDGLWEVCVVRFAAFLSRLTLRRVLEFFAIAILAIAFAQTFPIDLALLFAGDILMYLELLVIVWLAAGRDNLLEAARFIERTTQGTVRAVGPLVAPRRSREPRVRTRPKIPSRSAKSSDDEGLMGALCAA